MHQGFDISKPHLTKAVLLVVETNEHETIALMLNRPANFTLNEKDFTAILLYGGPHSSFHTGDQQRVFIGCPIAKMSDRKSCQDSTLLL